MAKIIVIVGILVKLLVAPLLVAPLLVALCYQLPRAPKNHIARTLE